jgi:AcrR family transcriptional regulator
VARPSRKKERQSQILDAYEKCIGIYGLEGATLERIAEEAGLARALIRHNVGNREDLLDALVSRFIVNSSKSATSLIDNLPVENRSEAMIEWLFAPGYTDPGLVLVSNALINAAINDPKLGRKMRKWSRDFVKRLAQVLEEEFPKENDQSIQAVAAGLVGIYFNVESLTPLGAMPELHGASKEAAFRLLSTLKS